MNQREYAQSLKVLNDNGVKLVDMSDHVGIDTFNDMLVAIQGVVDASSPLALDSEVDREILVRRLYIALGVVP